MSPGFQKKRLQSVSIIISDPVRKLRISEKARYEINSVLIVSRDKLEKLPVISKWLGRKLNSKQIINCEFYTLSALRKAAISLKEKGHNVNSQLNHEYLRSAFPPEEHLTTIISVNQRLRR